MLPGFSPSAHSCLTSQELRARLRVLQVCDRQVIQKGTDLEMRSSSSTTGTVLWFPQQPSARARQEFRALAAFAYASLVSLLETREFETKCAKNAQGNTLRHPGSLRCTSGVMVLFRASCCRSLPNDQKPQFSRGPVPGQ